MFFMSPFFLFLFFTVFQPSRLTATGPDVSALLLGHTSDTVLSLRSVSPSNTTGKARSGTPFSNSLGFNCLATGRNCVFGEGEGGFLAPLGVPKAHKLQSECSPPLTLSLAVAQRTTEEVGMDSMRSSCTSSLSFGKLNFFSRLPG